MITFTSNDLLVHHKPCLGQASNHCFHCGVADRLDETTVYCRKYNIVAAQRLLTSYLPALGADTFEDGLISVRKETARSNRISLFKSGTGVFRMGKIK